MQDCLLKGKTILFLGSSVTYGSAADGISFVEHIAARTGCYVIKEAISGTTLADLDDQSYVSRLKRISGAVCPDLFVCQLSTNDASHCVPLGKTKESEPDTQTVTGAVTAIVQYVREKWRCLVVFYTNPRYESAAYAKMVEALHTLASSMDFSVIDLWNDTALNRITPKQRARFMADGIHPTDAGYHEWWTPAIEKKLIRFCLCCERNAFL